MTGPSEGWHRLVEPDRVASPALLVYPDRIEANIRRMVSLAGGAERLRPHVKTHKLPEVVRLQQNYGIRRFKCATIAEAEMTAGCGPDEILLAYPLVGPTVRRLLDLMRRFPNVRFCGLFDNAESLGIAAAQARAAGATLELLLDIDCGMGRTGIPAGREALALYRLLAGTPGVSPGGLHVYDGHVHASNPAERHSEAEAAFAPTRSLREQIRREGLPVPRTVAGGTPTFAHHLRDPENEGSPGTCLLWDAGYGEGLPDLGFAPAAVLLTRVVSRPRRNRLCLDLGYKAVASESPPPRIRLIDLPDAVPLLHNEEHLVVETSRASEFPVGTALYGIPWHICPTVALHEKVVVVEDGRVRAQWKVVARDRTLTA